MEFNWDLFQDPEAPITAYHVALSRTDDTTSLITPWLHVGHGIGTAQHARIDLRSIDGALSAFVHGQQYFALVRTTNRVGLQSISVSHGVEIDGTPPRCTVLDGVVPGNDTDVLTDSLLGMQWACEDEESGIATLVYGVGTRRGDTDVLPLRAHDSPATVFLSPDVVVVPGTRYFILVVATNGAGQAVAVSSDGAINDHTPPELVTIDGGGPYFSAAPPVNEFHATWHFQDLESGVVAYTVWLVELGPGGEETLASATHDAGTASSGTFPTLSPWLEGQDYHVVVTAVNSFGLSATGSSGPIRLDNTPPSCSWIIDGKGADPSDDISVHTSEDFLSVCWLCSDGASGIVSASVTLKDSVSAVLFSETIPAQNGVQCSSAIGTALTTGPEVYTFEVTVTDGVGLPFTVTSDGFTVDATPAEQTAVSHGSGPSDVPLHLTDDANFDAHFLPWTEDTSPFFVTL